MAAVVAAAEVVLELRAEHFGDGDILDEDGVLAVGMVAGEGLGRDVLSDPVGVAGAAVEGGGQGGGGAKVVDGAGEAILEDAAGVDLGDVSAAWCECLAGLRGHSEAGLEDAVLQAEAVVGGLVVCPCPWWWWWWWWQ